MKTEVVLGDVSWGSCVWHGSWESGWSQVCDSFGSLLSVCCVCHLQPLTLLCLSSLPYKLSVNSNHLLVVLGT